MGMIKWTTASTEFTLSNVKSQYEKYHTGITDIGDKIASTEIQTLVVNALEYGAAKFCTAPLVAALSRLITPLSVVYTAEGIWRDYVSQQEAEKYARMLKALAVAGPSGYIDAELELAYEILDNNTIRICQNSVKVTDWSCYSDGSVMA